MEETEQGEDIAKRLRYFWNQYLTTAARQEKSKTLESFLAEFLKIYHVVGGDASKMPSFGNIHSVSNMLAREFQTIILAKCQKCDEELLVKYLCYGQGLMILEALCILANKIAGCSNELTNLLVTLLPVILRIPPDSYNVLAELEMVMKEWENHFQDPKSMPYHSALIHALILDHCKVRYEASVHATRQSPQTCRMEDVSKPHAKTLTEETQLSTELGKEKTDSASTTGDSDALTSISSMGSAGLLSSTISESSGVQEPLKLQLHRQSSGISSGIVESPELTPIETTFDRATTIQEYSSMSPRLYDVTPSTNISCYTKTSGEDTLAVNTFELLLLVLSVLENLCCRDASSHDAALVMRTSGQLIDIIVCLSGGQSNTVKFEEFDVDCTWDCSTCTAAQLAIFRSIFSLTYSACKNSKSAKQLAKSSYIKKLVDMVEDAIARASFPSDQFDELVEEVENLQVEQSRNIGSQKLSRFVLWTRFQLLLYLSHSLQGLLSFLCASVHFGTLINSSLLALSRELLEQFSVSSGFDCVVTVALKMEEIMASRGCEKVAPNDATPKSAYQMLGDFPRFTLSCIISNIGKIISLIKKGKSDCCGGAESPTRRKSRGSFSQPQPQFEPMTSEVEESSESAGDMELEDERRNLTSAARYCCPVLAPVSSLLTIFKGSKTQYLASQVLACLAKVGVCSCVKPDDLISSLLTRFLHQPRTLQPMILKLINQLVLSAVDTTSVALNAYESAANYTSRVRRTRKSFSKSPKSSPARSDSGFSAAEVFSHTPGKHGRGFERDDPPSWSCLSQYCALMTCGDPVVSVEAAKSLKPLVNFGSKNLKEDLFHVVILPSILRCDSRNKRNGTGIPTSTVESDARAEYSEIFERRIGSGEPFPLESQKPRTQSNASGISKDVLKIILGYLPSHLVSDASRSLFFSCGGLNELKSFLAVEELQELVVGVFEFLATLEDRANNRRSLQGFPNNRTDDSDSGAIEGKKKEDNDTAIKAFLSLLRYTAVLEEPSLKVSEQVASQYDNHDDTSRTPLETFQNITDEVSIELQKSKRISSSSKSSELSVDTIGRPEDQLQDSVISETTDDASEPSNTIAQDAVPLVNLSLRIHVWKACLNLLVSNKFFIDMFLASNGPVYSYKLLCWLMDFLESQLTCDVSDGNWRSSKDTVALFEVVLAVSIRLAYAGFWQDKGVLPNVDSLLHHAERTVKCSSLLKEFIGRGLCDSLTKAAVKHSLSPVGTHQDGTDNIETSVLQRQGENNAEWSQLMLEDELDTPPGGKKSAEDGYEADNEVNTDSSDESESKVARQRKPVRDRRRSDETKEDLVYFRGLIIYPQICQFLLKILNAAYGFDSCSPGSKKVLVLTHAAQCLLSLVKDCEQNCKVLCEQGLLCTILKCYDGVLKTSDESLQGLQSIVLEVFVNLATQKIREAELWDFIQLFKSESLPVELLCGALAHIGNKAASYPGPAYVLSFPCRLYTIEPRSKPTGKRAHGQRLQAKPLRKGRRGRSPFDSPGDASSEGATTEASLSRAKKLSPEHLERSRLTKTQLKHAGSQQTEISKQPSHQLRRTGTYSGHVEDNMEMKDTPHLSQSDDSADLPSPFKVKAVNLRFQGNVLWPSSGFSIALWVRFHNLRRYSECDTGSPKDDGRPRGYAPRMYGMRSSRSMSFTNEWSGVRSDVIPSCEEAIHLCSLGSRRSLFETWVLPSSGCLLFRWTKSTKGGTTDGYDIVKELVTRLPALTRGRWHHLVVSFSQTKNVVVDNTRKGEPHGEACKILTIVDGTDTNEHNFGPPLPWHEDAKCALSVLLLGHVTLSTTRSDKPGEGVLVLPEGYDLGNLLVFTASARPLKQDITRTEWVIGKDGAFYLYSLGPNSISVGHLERDFTLVPEKRSDPSKPFLTASRLWSRLSISERAVAAELSPGYLTSPHVVIPDVESAVKGNLSLSYSPMHYKVFQQHIRLPGADDRSRWLGNPDSATKSPIKPSCIQSEARLFLDVESVRCSSLLEAAHDVGGMSVFIYLLAKVVEISSDHKAQANALSVVLSLQRNCEYHARAMDEEFGYDLLKRILLSPQCKIGYHVLKVLMEAACDGDVFKHTNLSDNPIMLNIDSNAAVRNVDIFKHFLLNWKIWEKAKQGVLEMLLSTLEILVHSSHPHYRFNINQFQKAELVQQLLIGCQERQGEGFKEIPATISTLYVNIISNIMGSPPDLTVMKAVCEFLIAIHPVEDTIRLQSPSRFYLAEQSFDFGRPAPFVSQQQMSPSPHTSLLSSEPRSPFASPSTCLIGSLGNSERLSWIPRQEFPVHESYGICKADDLRRMDHTLIAEEAKEEEINHVQEIENEDSKQGERKVRDAQGKGTYSILDGSKGLKQQESSEVRATGLTSRSIFSDPSTAVISTGGLSPVIVTGAQSPMIVTSTMSRVSSSCPQPLNRRGLSVEIPGCSTFSTAALSGSMSGDGGSILLHESHFRDPRKPSSPVSPATPQTPLGRYMRPGSQPMSIGSKPMSIQKTSSAPQDGQSSVDVQEYDFINESDFNSLKSSLAHPSSTDEYLVVEGFPGIKSSTRTYRPLNPDEAKRRVIDNMAKMRLGLLKLLQKVLFSLQAEQVPAVIGGVLKTEYLLIWVSHDSDNVRELVIKILCLFLQRAEPEQCSRFTRNNGFHLLANQLYDHSVTKDVVEACLGLLVGRPVDLQKDYAYTGSTNNNLFETVRPLGVVPLLSLLENSLVCPHLFRLLVKHLSQLFFKVDDLCLKAVANGLLQTICSVICGVSCLQHKQSKNRRIIPVDVGELMEGVQQFIACIVRKACCTCGNLYFQMFEDLLVVLENLENWNHRKRDYGSSVSYMARYLRYFAVQVALHFFQEICKEEPPIGNRKGKKNAGIRFPFRGLDKSSEFSPFNPVSSWIHLSPGQNLPTLDPSLLKSSPTSANFNEQTRRFQSIVHVALNFVVHSKTFFLPEDFSAVQFYSADLQVHESLRPGIVKEAPTRIDIGKEFTQFVFSLLLEFLETCLDGKWSTPSKLFYVSKDVLKTQLGKLLVFMVSPGQDLDLSYFALQITNHPQAKKFLYALTTSSGGGKHKEKLSVYLPQLLTNSHLTDEQKIATKNLMSLLESCGLHFTSTEDVATRTEETHQWDQADTASMVEWQKKRTEANRPLSQRIVTLGIQVSASAMDVTRVVVEIQDGQRQTLLKHNRDALSAEVQVRKKWRQLIERLTHERSIWYDRDFFPTSWKLDPTEGPSRVRCRLQRCHLDVDDRYIMDEYRNDRAKECSTPLAYLFEDTTSSRKKNVYYIFDTPDTIRFLYHCKNITLDNKIQGVILIGESHMYFIGEEAIADTDITQILLGNKDTMSLSWSNDEIQEIRSRRYCLQDIGIEVFLSNGRTYLLAFETNHDREVVLEQFKQRGLPIYETPVSEYLYVVTAKWRAGNLSNFEYLTELNKMAGRTFNDLMQYPVFPFVLSDFTSEVLDLNDTKALRDLSKPIAVQNPAKEAKYRETYRWLKEEFDRQDEKDHLMAPYHYGSHYSNSGTVLHFLVRLPPFTKMFLQYQDRSFDIPDRTFHSMATTWRLSSFESSTDVKELIPDFFFLPEFLENFEGFDFGFRQNGVRVMDVMLPPWAKNNPRLFILIHRQALETEYASHHLHQWIDLVFGYKQTGPEAVDAINVFHPATYFGVEVETITDPIRKKALKTMIETYGQTPRQLFNFPHCPRVIRKPQALAFSDAGSVTSLNTLKFDIEVASFTGNFINRFTSSFSSDNTLVGSNADTIIEILKPVTTVEGLKWGQYVGSPALPAPVMTLAQPLSAPVCTLVCDRGDRVHVLCHDTTLVTVYEKPQNEIDERMVLCAVVSWAAMDGGLSVFLSGSCAASWLLDMRTPDKVTSCAVTCGCTSLFIGSSSGALSVLPVKYNHTVDSRIEVLGSRVRLYGHSKAVTCLQICHEYSVAVSASQDGRAIIWDLNRLSYVRSLEHTNAVSVVAISRKSGDIATVSHTVEEYDGEIEEGSELFLWTINGRAVGHKKCEHTINCVDFSRAPEGLSVNVIATGLSNGAIRLWSTWDLQHIRDIAAPEQQLYPISSVAFSEDSQRLFAINSHGKLMMWQRRDKIYTKPPTIIAFPASYCSPRPQFHNSRAKAED